MSDAFTDIARGRYYAGERKERRTPHPCRCETCQHFEGYMCTFLGDRLSNVEIVHIERVGCLSHPQARECLMQDVTAPATDTDIFHGSALQHHDEAIRQAERERVLDTISRCPEAIIERRNERR